MEPDFIRLFIDPLEELEVQYMITGGVASVIYGDPRFTRDIDIVLELRARDVQRLRSAFSTDDFYVPPAETLLDEAPRPRFGHSPAAPLLPTLQRALRALDPELVFVDTGTLRDAADVRIFPIRAAAWLIGTAGVLALFLAAIGLYGVIAFSVSRRVREIGIRLVLGAETSTVVGMVVRRGVLLVAMGGVVGAVLAAAAARALSGALFVGVFDPASSGIAFTILLAVAALANWIPARRASHVDPIITLRAG